MEPKRKTEAPKPPSEEFERAFRAGIGTIKATCQLCGRNLFASGSSALGYEEGELEVLQAKAKKDPEKYCELGDDGLSLGEIDGRQFVMGCPCNKLRAFEDWVWQYRRQIAEYLKARAASRLEESRSDAHAMEGIPKLR